MCWSLSAILFLLLFKWPRGFPNYWYVCGNTATWHPLCNLMFNVRHLPLFLSSFVSLIHWPVALNTPCVAGNNLRQHIVCTTPLCDGSHPWRPKVILAGAITSVRPMIKGSVFAKSLPGKIMAFYNEKLRWALCVDNDAILVPWPIFPKLSQWSYARCHVVPLGGLERTQSQIGRNLQRMKSQNCSQDLTSA